MKKRKDGRYARQLVVGKKQAVDKDGNPRVDADGMPVMVKVFHTVYGNSQKEVNEAFAQAKVDIGKGVDVKAASDSFKLWADRFIANKEAQRLSYGHLDRLRSDLKHLSPLNEIAISKVTIGDIQAIIDQLAKWHDGRAGLAKNTLKSIRQTAGGVMKIAIASRVITYNPADYVNIPENAKKESRSPISEEQQRWVCDTEHRAKRAAMIMLYSGLRRGELLALTWSDVDLDEGTITVSKSVQFENGRPVLAHGHAKTDAGLRTVNIPKKLCRYLKAERNKDSHIYIIHNSRGGIMSQSAWRRLWESYMAELNVRYGFTQEEQEKLNITSVHHPEKLPMKIETFTAHQLRHTFCTLMYHAGVDVLTARDQMGHSDISTTLQIYTHLDKTFKKKNINKLDKYLGQSGVSQVEKNSTVIRLNRRKA